MHLRCRRDVRRDRHVVPDHLGHPDHPGRLGDHHGHDRRRNRLQTWRASDPGSGWLASSPGMDDGHRPGVLPPAAGCPGHGPGELPGVAPGHDRHRHGCRLGEACRQGWLHHAGAAGARL